MNLRDTICVGNLTGLFGDNDGDVGNDLHSKDNDLTQGNASMVTIHNDFGLSWRAAENESLFTYTGGRTYESYQNLNFVPTFDIPANIDPTITQLCKSNSDCIYDYYVTANRRFGQMSANVSDEFARISSYTIPVATCGFPSNVSDAVWVADGYTQGSSARLLCNRNFFQVDVVITCTPSGNWSDFNVTCMPLPTCGKPQVVANGYWVPVEGTDGRRATLQCKDGYYTPIEKVRIICSLNGTWTYVEVQCNIVTTSSSSSMVSTLEHTTSNRNTLTGQTTNTEPQTTYTAPQTITTEQATTIKDSTVQESSTSIKDSTVEQSSTTIKDSTVEQSSTTNDSITTEDTSLSTDNLVTSTAGKVSTNYQHGEIDSTSSVSTSIHTSTIKQDNIESTTTFKIRTSTTQTTESSTTSSVKERTTKPTSDASRPLASYKYNALKIVTLTACVLCTPPPTNEEAALMKFLSSEDFTRITDSGSKHSAQLSTKRTSFKHKYVVCGSGSIVSYHSANSIDIQATAASSNAAHQKAAVIVSRMIAHMPSTYCHTLAARAQVGVFTKAESMAVYPDYAYMADRPECRGICSGGCASTCTFDGRKWSVTAGSGGRLASILDDNLLCDSRDPYRHGFNVLIHEFGHTIHGYALDGSMKNTITNAYNAARSRGTWSASSYAMSNEKEYFAQGTSAWFNADHRNPHGNIMSS
ncbi:unnamed protein product [Mytilus edulis]|uniref:Sushi domain-containing protein n=1 Tax=Mytilus edulis TaxID=6550 RepID=A0A8S3V508_MYTED|nr:unnamed protein product [Mytilus edulis]